MKRFDLIAGLALAAGSACALPRRARAAELTPLAVAVVPVDAASEVYVAENEGFFARHGIKAAIQQMSNGAAISAGIVSGALDVGSVNVVSLASAFEKKVPLRILAPGSVYDAKAPTSAILVKTDSAIRSAKDLAGKTIATNAIKGLAQIAALAWIDKNGGDAKSAKFLEMPFASMPAALDGGRIDAAVLQEPGLSQTRDSARILGNVYDGFGARWLIDAWVASESWIAKNEDLAHRFTLAMLEAAAWANRHRDKTLPIVAANMKLAPEVARAMRRATFTERVDPALAQPPVDMAATYGVLAGRFNANELFAAAALKER